MLGCFLVWGSVLLLEGNKNFNKMERTKCEVYSRIVGYLRPIKQWNVGKQAEWKDRKTFKIDSKKIKGCEVKNE